MSQREPPKNWNAPKREEGDQKRCNLESEPIVLQASSTCREENFDQLFFRNPKDQYQIKNLFIVGKDKWTWDGKLQKRYIVLFFDITIPLS